METTDQPKNKGGRPPGAMNKLAIEARRKAEQTGLLPHEILLKIARGDRLSYETVDPETGEITIHLEPKPELQMRIDAAKSAAPYYAPKLSAVEVASNMSDGELDAIIKQLATEAGVIGLPGGEGATPEAEANDDGQQAPRRRRTAF